MPTVLDVETLETAEAAQGTDAAAKTQPAQRSQRCPACGERRRDGDDECGACGVLASRWKQRTVRAARAGMDAAASSRAATRPSQSVRSSRFGRRLVLLVLGLAAGAAVVGGYKRLHGRPGLPEVVQAARSQTPAGRSGPVRLDLKRQPGSDLDAYIQLPARPMGMAWAGVQVVIPNPADPWGFLRITARGKNAVRAETVPVVETGHDRKIMLDFVTWNGQQLVGHADGAVFEANGQDLFTIHDPETLQVARTVPAPPNLGALVWDGEGYWAATRRDTADRQDQPPFLYRLGPELQVAAQYAPPGVGCRGLAFDGSLLYFADVFDDAVHVLDVRAGQPELRHTWNTPFSYLSGIGFDGEHLWLGEYQNNRLHRVSDGLRRGWLAAAGLDPARISVERPESAAGAPADAAELATLRDALRSEDRFERMSAEVRLKELRRPIDFDREQDSFADDDIEPTEVVVRDWRVELEGDGLYASWDIAFGEQLLTALRGGESGGTISIPLFLHVEATVQGGSLRKPVTRTFDPDGAEDRRERVLLARGLGPGEYRVSLLFHVQYIGAEGQASILNHSTTSLEVSR